MQIRLSARCVWLASKILRMWAALHPALKLHSAKIMPTETLEASTAYYAKIGGKAVVEITTSEEVPVDCTGLAKLFAGSP